MQNVPVNIWPSGGFEGDVPKGFVFCGKLSPVLVGFDPESAHPSTIRLDLGSCNEGIKIQIVLAVELEIV